MDQVTSPTLEREKRLNAQIESVREESKQAIERIKAFKEAQREKRELQRNMAESDKEKDDEKRLSLKSFMASEKGTTVGFSFVAELIARKFQSFVLLLLPQENLQNL